VRLWHILFLSTFASIAWFLAYFFSADNKINLNLILNTLLRFGIYLSVSYLFMLLNSQRNELNEKNKELLELNNEKNTMLAIAAHDIRNSIGAINSFSGLLLEKLGSKPNLANEVRITKIMNKSSEYLLNLVTNLLDLSKVQSAQIHLNKKLTDYNSFIEARIDLLQIIAQKKNIQLFFLKNPAIGNVTFDPVYLSEVIDNLITNAIKYSEPNTEIHIELKIQDNWILTKVIDSGPGIKESEIEGIFKPFSKTSNKSSSGEKSTGLGLAIAQKVVNLHGGEIGAISTFGTGSTFYFTLPY
jgi:signal transduction histidine kinase